MVKVKAKLSSTTKRKHTKAGSSAPKNVGGILNFKVARIVQKKKQGNG